MIKCFCKVLAALTEAPEQVEKAFALLQMVRFQVMAVGKLCVQVMVIITFPWRKRPVIGRPYTPVSYTHLAYPANKKYCVVNNTYEPQETTVYKGDGESFTQKLKANEILWYEL